MNATVGAVIGPASAVMQPPVEGIIAELTGRIEDSQLATDLKTRIDQITDVSSALTDEEQQRLFGDNVLSELFAGLESDLAAADITSM